MTNWWNQLKSSWHRSLSLVWILIIAQQWLSYTEPFWFRQTTATVLIVLVTVAVIEIIFPVKLQYRLIVEAIAIIYIVYRTITNYGLYVADPWATTFRERVLDIAIHMVPYIWFALGASVLLLLSSWWVTSKTRILWFIGMNIVAFAALDSFTSIILWQEVAWIVAVGMAWLVSQHLRSFQLHYPHGWEYVLEYPFKIVINIAVVFSLVILIGVNMPDVRPTLKDPFTAWQDWNGTSKSLSSIGKKRATQSGTTSTDSNKNTSSGYGLNDENLGGGFDFDYTPVMTVLTDLRTYMRGETRSVYSGNGWSDDDQSKRGSFKKVNVGQQMENNAATKVTTRTLKQTVNVLNDNEFPVLFGAYSVTAVDSLNGEESGSGLFWRSINRELLWDADGTNRAYPQNYELTSEVPVIPVSELREQTYEQLYGENVDEQLLQLPDNFPSKVRYLAEEITAQGQTPYEKVALLQQYLQQTFPYTNKPDLTRKKSSDLVEAFLFEVKEGYCDYYSTALVTMARSLDLPARWVKGYAPGSQPEIPDNLPFEQTVMVSNYYTITNADAHSWAEVYFGEYGWIPVEATPGFNFPLLTQTEQDIETEPEDQEKKKPEPVKVIESSVTGDQGFQVGHWVVMAACAVLLAWSIFLGWKYRFALRFLLQRLKSGRPLSPDQKVVVETERWVRYLRRKGMIKEEHETLREAVVRWSQERPDVASNLSSLLGLFEQAKYSPDVIEDKDWRSVYTESLRLRRMIRARK